MSDKPMTPERFADQFCHGPIGHEEEAHKGLAPGMCLVRDSIRSVVSTALATYEAGKGANMSNHTLIAAAPDLLEVVRSAVESQGWDGSDPDDDRWMAFYASARAAIAKALGKDKRRKEELEELA